MQARGKAPGFMIPQQPPTLKARFISGNIETRLQRCSCGRFEFLGAMLQASLTERRWCQADSYKVINQYETLLTSR